MTKLLKVLVAYDGSPQSKEALHWAIYFSRRIGAAVSAVKVFEPYLTESRWKEVGVATDEMFEQFAAVQKKDLQLMEEVKELGRGQEIEITTAILQGHVARTLLEYAKTNGISMIVTGTRGYGAVKQLLLGSVTHGLVSLSDIPVMVVKKCPVVEFAGGSLILTSMRKILVAYDGFPQSQAALNWAVEIAKLIDAKVTAVKVFEPFQVGMAYGMAESGNAPRTATRLHEMELMNEKLMTEAKELAKQQGLDITTEILGGSVLESLLEYTAKHGFDIVTVGAQGHGVLDRLPLGSVPHGLVSLSPVPVMVVKT
jgi:nucleotide-binding universal stress UspA family protein